MTYIAKNLLYAAMASLEGMQFNWAKYVASRMHNELSSKKALGKVPALLCSNYLLEAIKYQLKCQNTRGSRFPLWHENRVNTLNTVTRRSFHKDSKK